MKGHEDYRELAAVYALGTLDRQEREVFELHLATGCEECESAMKEARQIADDLAHAVEPVAPSAAVRERLLARVRQDARQSASGKPRRAVWFLATAACLAAAVGLGIQLVSLQRDLEQERNARLVLERELAAAEESVQALTAPTTQTVSLAGQGPAPGARARAYIDAPNRRLFLYVYDLPEPPVGQTYQLWVIVAGTPVSVGTFGVRPDGATRFDAEPLPPFDGAVTVAVTVEPEGGVPQPTGPMVLMGS